TVVRGIMQSGRRIGTVRLSRDLGEMRRSLLGGLSLTFLLLVGSSLAALVIAARTQRMISEPILDLTRAAKAISATEGFSARATARGADELGVLVAAFNEMLDQIQKRDAALRDSREELVRSEARYRALVRGIPDVLFRFDPAGKYLDYQVSDPKLLPFPPEAFLGKNVRDVVPPEFAEHCLQGIAKAGATGEPQSSECELPMPGGRTAFMEVRFVALEDGDVLAVVRDVTERKRAQDELRSLTAQLEQRVAERTAELMSLNKELEAFSYSVSHDLRAPLRAINGYSSLLLDKETGRLDAESRGYLERTAGAARRMAEIIDDLLNLSRVTRAPMEPVAVDLSALARAAAAEQRALAPGKEVSVEIDEGACARGDEKLLRLLLSNLFSNAWKFTSRAAAPRVEFRVRRDGGRTVYAVRDNGAGFDQAYADKLFKPFSRLHSQADFAGTGVGLATVSRIVERHGGRIWAEGAVDRGAAFYFTLPEAEENHGSQDDTAR
ncbi:MAG: ATP-binding protein, partial [Elusimicrobia bacterium]|nr:ATP-binding protein [Elusimicrobiota bacterium]